MNLSLLPSPDLSQRARAVTVQDGPIRQLEIPRGADTSYFTHGLFRYVGKLPPPLVAYLLDRYTRTGDTVLDPMCGGGTTAIESVAAGREVLSFDLNPVSRLVTQALSHSANISRLQAFSRSVIAQSKATEPPKKLAEYFSPEAFGLLCAGLAAAVAPVESVLVLSIARKASFANTKKINTVVDPGKVPRDPAQLLARHTEFFTSAFTQFNREITALSTVTAADARSLPLPDTSVDFVILHPPYLTNTAFSEVTELQLRLLGARPSKLRKRELAYRGSYFHVTNGLKKYLLGLAAILAEANRCLRTGGHMALVIGDGRIDRIRIPVATIAQEFAGDLGLVRVERAIHRLNNQTGWTLSRKMRHQHLLVFQKRDAAAT